MAVSKVFMICNAYESGIGHGYKSTGVISPHRGNTDEYEAFEIGYVKGIKNRNGGECKMKTIEFKEVCKECKGTGLYVGTTERCGATVVCQTCKGTG